MDTTATGRLRFERSRGGALFQLLGPWAGGVLFLAFGAYLLTRGLPDALFSVLAFVFAALMLAGGVVATRRGLDRRIIEVGADGAWLPGLGEQPWAAFAEIRVELFSGPAGGSGQGPGRVVTYRRLGFVPSDPALAAARGAAAGLVDRISAVFLAISSATRGHGPLARAPYGVLEQELGRDRFDQLVGAVAAHHPVTRLEEPTLLPGL